MNEGKGRKELLKNTSEINSNLTDQIEKLKCLVNDKSITSSTSQQLKQGGTKEGAKAVENAFKIAEKKIDQNFDQQKLKHSEFAKKGEKDEKAIKDMADSENDDRNKIENATRNIKIEGNAELSFAAVAAKNDNQWLNELEKKRKKEREFSTKTANNLGKIIKNSKIEITKSNSVEKRMVEELNRLPVYKIKKKETVQNGDKLWEEYLAYIGRKKSRIIDPYYKNDKEPANKDDKLWAEYYISNYQKFDPYKNYQP